ncbi:GerAB/ArcD/ProY family transporter [Paenibacillus sp. B01]|uniref:GerAB/ArcD/ProY family transporter n=1 Tax=Paenibacillus sp. B01 TaxID=2660554 RepID=UPI00129A6351|nr:endospore germination permease [Paenibacillus sp. B01]QGG57488.1 GerAB/ArcD/ProY family transporter [Paenibacillus sp. B01]
MNEERNTSISARGFAVLTVYFMIGTSILIAPAGLALAAKQDAWMAALFGVGLNIALVALYAALGKLRQHESLVQMCVSALGRWAGGLLGLAFVAFFYLLASLMIGDLGYFLTTQNLPETPIEVLQLLFVLLAVYAVRLGKSAYSRAAELFFPFLLLLFTLLVLTTLPRIDPRNFEPLLEFGLRPIVKGGINLFALQEMIVLLMLYPYVRRAAGRSGAMIGGTVLGGIVLVVTTAASIGVLCAGVTANQLFPAYALAKNISIGHFLERIEGMIIFIWVLSILIKIVITFDATLIGLGQLFGLRSTLALTLPLGVGMVVVAQLCYPNTVFVQDFLSKNWTPFASIFLVFAPLLLYAVHLIRARAKKQPAPSS